MSRKERGRVFLENIWLIALIILIIGIGVAIAEFYSYGESFVGEILISGGFFGIFVYLIVGRHEKYVLREEVLGLRPDLTLIDQLMGQPTFRDYFYTKRSFEWELYEHEQDTTMWAVKLKDTVHMKVEKDTRELVMMRECDVEFSPQSRPRVVRVNDKTAKSSTSVQLQPSTELSTAVKRYYNLRHDFRSGHDYKLVSAYRYPPNMKKNGDYIEMKTPVYTRDVVIKIKLPQDFDTEGMGWNCYIMDLRYERARTLSCDYNTARRIITIESGEPVHAGQTILFKYFERERDNP